MRSEEQGELSLARPPVKASVPMELIRAQRRAEEAEARADELAERLKYAEKLLAGREVTA